MLAKDVKNGQYFTTSDNTLVYRRIFNHIDHKYLDFYNDDHRTACIVCSTNAGDIVCVACKTIVTIVS